MKFSYLPYTETGELITSKLYFQEIDRLRLTVCSKYVSRYRIKLLMSIVPLKVIWLYSQRTTRLVIGEVIISAIRNSSNYGGN